MPGQKRTVRMRFPFKGVDQSAPLSAMPEGACPDMRNMLPFGAQVGTTNVSRNRAIGVKRAGLVDGPASVTANRTAVGAYIWRTIYRPTVGSNAVDPIELLFMFTSSIHIQSSKITNGVAAAFAHEFAVPNSATVAMTRPTFAVLGTKLFVVGPNNTDRTANACYLSAYDITPGGTGIPSAATYWNIQTPLNGANLCCA